MLAMWPKIKITAIVFALLIGFGCTPALAAKLGEVRTVDDEHLMIYWQDGCIQYKDTGRSSGAPPVAYENFDGDKAIRFNPPLNTAVAVDTGNYTLSSADDSNYISGAKPTHAWRKSKVNGTNRKWPEPDYTVEHTIFLKLPHKLQQEKHYTLKMNAALNTDTISRDFSFDIFSSISEAIHVNIIGYDPNHTVMKSADLYMWLGNGGARDYSDYVGRKVMLVNVDTGEKYDVSTVSFWKKSGSDFGGRNLLASDVWNCDFSAFNKTGAYRLCVEGVGCSPSFVISRDVYYQPYKTSVRGFFYMRIGADPNITPMPRQPRFIPGKDPVNFRVYRTTFGPLHPDWKKYRRDVGDPWDITDWSPYNEPGNPTNPNAWGGHSDAGDWDRNNRHISIMWDMLLPYFLSNGNLSDDDLGIPESGNGIPDIIDEARYEVDFWLRLRDGKGGYSWGLNDPPNDCSVMYQAHASPYMAWASAANCAMLADCFRIAGKPDLMNQYRDAAIEAWKIADETELDLTQSIGNGVTRGRDLKMLAAAFLYNVTGDRFYEDAMAKETVVTSPVTQIDNKGKYCQYWGTAAYLMCAKMGWQPIHYPQLLENMKASIIYEAKQKNVSASEQRPSRRSSDEAYGWFQSTQAVEGLCIAHAFATEPPDKDAFLKAMLLEADYGLGRNPMNMVQMTGLGSRCVEDIYTSGRNDGTPGVHPGHTPYMGAVTWSKGFTADPQWYAERGYPTWNKWPYGEALWRARYCYANNEFTPQETMRGKMVLLGYLYALGEPHKTR